MAATNAPPARPAVETPSASLSLQIIRKGLWIPEELDARIRSWTPRSDLGRIVKRILAYRELTAEMMAELYERMSSCMVVESSLACIAIRTPNSRFLTPSGLIEDYGGVSTRFVTNAGRDFLVDAFQNLTELEAFDFAGLGTGTIAEAATDTALGTELTTQYSPDNTRATGTPSEPASNQYRSVGTNTLDSGTPAVTEHGLFSAASAGTLWDRSVFSVINLDGANGDGLQTTYTATFSSGG